MAIELYAWTAGPLVDSLTQSCAFIATHHIMWSHSHSLYSLNFDKYSRVGHVRRPLMEQGS